MASVVNDSGGRKRIQFVSPDGRRRTLRLGKCDLRTAQLVAAHVEALLTVKTTGQPLPAPTAAWLAGVGPELRQRLERCGLVEPERRLTVGEFLDGWLQRKRGEGHATASLIAWKQAVTEVMRLFGPKPLAELVHADGEAFVEAMRRRGLAPTTVHKRLVHIKGALEDASRLGHVAANPWRFVRCRGGDPSARRAYVPVPDVQRVMECLPSVWWRLLMAMARFGGLRIPSEAFSATWGDVDWAGGRLVVPAPKTRRAGKPYRTIPLFPLLRPHLQEAFERAAEGQEFIFPDEFRRRALGPAGWRNCNLRSTLAKAIRRAGLEPWPRLWHSLRASCESDLARSFPLATVTKWLGNTPSVALRHYVDPTDAAFAAALTWTPADGPAHVEATSMPTAVPPLATGDAKSGAQVTQKAAYQALAQDSKDTQDEAQVLAHCGTLIGLDERKYLLCKDLVERKGVEPIANSRENQGFEGGPDAKSGAPNVGPIIDGDLTSPNIAAELAARLRGLPPETLAELKRLLDG